MTTTHKLAAFAAAMAVLPVATATAADRHVSINGSDASTTCSSAQPCRTLARAATVATSGDVLRVGPGQFSALTTAKRLSIVGSGAGGAAFNAATDTRVSGAPALRLAGGGSVRDLRVSGNAELLRSPVNATPYEMTGVRFDVGGGRGLLASGAGVDVRAERLSAFVGSGGLGGVHVTAGARIALLDSDVVVTQGDGTGLLVQEGTATVERSSFVTTTANTGRSNGAMIERGALRATRSVFSGGQYGVHVGRLGTAELADSAVIAFRTTAAQVAPVAARVHGYVETAALRARGTTFFAYGPDVQAAVAAQAVAGGSAGVDLANSIARATDTTGPAGDVDLLAQAFVGSTATISARHSSFTTTSKSGTGPTSITAADAENNVTGDPRFLDEAQAKLGLRGDSPLLDRGDAALVTDGQLDLPGNPRSLDSTGDCVAAPEPGAFELAGAAGPGCAGGAGGQDADMFGDELGPLDEEAPFTDESGAGEELGPDGPGGVDGAAQGVRPRLDRIRIGDGARRVRFRLSEPATIEIVVRRKTGQRVKTIRRKIQRAGARSMKIPGHRLANGRYMLRIVAIDADGLRSPVRVIGVRVKPRR